jgi:Tfp pilus assembly protein PilV
MMDTLSYTSAAICLHIRQRSRKRLGTSGTTFVEVIIAMIIFSLIMLYGLSFFVYGNRSGARAREKKFAMQMAMNDIERVKTSSYASIPVLNTGTTTYAGLIFTKIQTAQAVNTAQEKYTTVIESVTWISGGGAGNSVSLRTIISEPLVW